MGRRETAQQRALAAGSHRRQVPRFAARRPVPDAIDPAVLGQQRTRAQAMADLIDGHSRPQQLRARDHAVAVARDPRDFLLHCPEGALSF